MEIKDFKELTSFVNEEADKFFETYGEKLVVEKLVGSLIKNLIFYFKLEAGYLKRKETRELKLKEAIETMPHGFMWKVFHYSLWVKIRTLKAEEFRKMKLEKAIATMPHSKAWQFFHSKLWVKIKAIKSEQDKVEQEEQEVVKCEQEPVTKELEPVTAIVTVKQEPIVEIEETD